MDSNIIISAFNNDDIKGTINPMLIISNNVLISVKK